MKLSLHKIKRSDNHSDHFYNGASNHLIEHGTSQFLFFKFELINVGNTLADLKGGARDARLPPSESKFLYFHAVFGKFLTK